MLHNKLPTERELNELKSELFSEMVLPDPVIERLKSASPDCHPMEVLHTEVSHLGECDPERDDNVYVLKKGCGSGRKECYGTVYDTACGSWA